MVWLARLRSTKNFLSSSSSGTSFLGATNTWRDVETTWNSKVKGYLCCYLSHERLGILGDGAYGGIVGWYGTPSQHGHVQLLSQDSELLFGLPVVQLVQEEDAGGVFAERRQLHALGISKKFPNLTLFPFKVSWRNTCKNLCRYRVSEEETDVIWGARRKNYNKSYIAHILSSCVVCLWYKLPMFFYVFLVWHWAWNYNISLYILLYIRILLHTSNERVIIDKTLPGQLVTEILPFSTKINKKNFHAFQ